MDGWVGERMDGRAAVSGIELRDGFDVVFEIVPV
jgi:hypothetical protein